MSAELLSAARRFTFPSELVEECYAALRQRGEEGAELFIALTARTGEGGGEIRFQRAIVPDQVCHRTPRVCW